jgi:hypothetical protein
VGEGAVDDQKEEVLILGNLMTFDVPNRVEGPG